MTRLWRRFVIWFCHTEVLVPHEYRQFDRARAALADEEPEA